MVLKMARNLRIAAIHKQTTIRIILDLLPVAYPDVGFTLARLANMALG
jgi:hypothetical protein